MSLDNEYSQKYRDYFSNNRSELHSYLPENIKTILDVGMGEGVFLLSLKKNRPNLETWGIELEKKSFEIANDKVDNALFGTVEENINSIPEGYFDCISFNDVLEHLVDPWQVLESVKAKLNKNGFILASIPNVRYVNNLKKIILDKDWEYVEEGILDSTHLRFFTEKSIYSLFKKSGYTVKLVEGLDKRTTLKAKIFNILTFGHFKDTMYLRFAVIAKPEKK
jgi:2-polyprenyl-3-methyl-5-hydroxy-6-metoxy-1,4-benzoquinol methylase